MREVIDFISRTGAEPFVWGQMDCMLWPCALVAEVTGDDPAHDLRGTYSTRSEANRIIKREGGVIDMARARLGHLRINWHQDFGVGIVRERGRWMGCIVSADRVLLKGDGMAVMSDGSPLYVWGF